MKVAILLCGHLRSWSICKKFFLQTFTNCDIFIHTYNNVFEYHPFINTSEMNKQKVSTEDIIKIIDLNNIKDIKIEDQDELIYDKKSLINKDIYFQYRKFYLCNQLRLDYEEKNNIKYDYVFKTRFDINYSLTLEKIFEKTEISNNNIYISSGPSVYPCDQIFFGHSDIITWLSTRLITMEGERKDSPHDWLKSKADNKLIKIPHFFTNIVRINLTTQ